MPGATRPSCMLCEDGRPTASWTTRPGGRRWRYWAAMSIAASARRWRRNTCQQTRHSCRTRDSAYLDDRRQAVACQPAASREDPPVAAASLPSRGVGAVGYQRARLAGGSWAEALLDQYDRRRLQPHSRAVRAERLYRREYAFALEIRGAIWTAGPL